MSFKVGDVVRLNSGGPDMTIKDEFHNAWCEYFDGRTLCSRIFNIDELTLVRRADVTDVSREQRSEVCALRE